jgi:hypothetical protein
MCLKLIEYKLRDLKIWLLILLGQLNVLLTQKFYVSESLGNLPNIEVFRGFAKASRCGFIVFLSVVILKKTVDILYENDWNL